MGLSAAAAAAAAAAVVWVEEQRAVEAYLMVVVAVISTVLLLGVHHVPLLEALLGLLEAPFEALLHLLDLLERLKRGVCHILMGLEI